MFLEFCLRNRRPVLSSTKRLHKEASGLSAWLSEFRLRKRKSVKLFCVIYNMALGLRLWVHFLHICFSSFDFLSAVLCCSVRPWSIAFKNKKKRLMYEVVSRNKRGAFLKIAGALSNADRSRTMATVNFVANTSVSMQGRCKAANDKKDILKSNNLKQI